MRKHQKESSSYRKLTGFLDVLFPSSQAVILQRFVNSKKDDPHTMQVLLDCLFDQQKR
jgi:hypothetical protein